MKHTFYDQATEWIEPTSHPFPGGMISGTDYRDMGPTLQCPCGSDGFYILCHFADDRTVGGYFTDGLCVECLSLVKVPTEVDDIPFTRPFRERDYIEPSKEDPALG